MQLDAHQAWLCGVRHCPSPHCDERPAGVTAGGIDLLVIHCISLPPQQFGGRYIDDLFLGQLDSTAHPYFVDIAQLRVSAHVLIRREGHVTQYVPFTHRAWHAGASQFQGRNQCNDFSIGIELEGYETLPYTEAQYQQLVRLTDLLQTAWPSILNEHIVGHSDIAPNRKTDPGDAFDWLHFHALLQAHKAR